MMAGEQTPQFTADDDRYRKRRFDAHVFEIFDMDGGHASKPRVCHVKGLKTVFADEVDRFVIDIGDEADGLLLVKFPCRGRDVVCGKMESEVASELGLLHFCDDGAVAVLVEAVDHHPFEITDAPEFACRDPAGLLDGLL